MNRKTPIAYAAWLTFTFACLVALQVVRTVYACSCLVPKDIKVAVGMSDVVFSGKVIKIVGTRPKTITFHVERIWKGAEEPEIAVKAYPNMDDGMCGYPFREGESYLVYANGKKKLTTSSCTRTAKLAEGKEDLKVLGEGKVPERK